MGDKEYELRFININEKQLKNKITKLGGKIHNKNYKMHIINYKLPGENHWIRIRDEGNKKTMTIKKDNADNFQTEHEVIISELNQADKILQSLHCKIVNIEEKYRETWHVKGAKEIVFDSYPGLPIFVEVEADTKKQLFAMCKKLNLNPSKSFNGFAEHMYNNLYGIPLPGKRRKINNLIFKDAHKTIPKLINKNKEEFIKILKEQNKLLKD